MNTDFLLKLKKSNNITQSNPPSVLASIVNGAYLVNFNVTDVYKSFIDEDLSICEDFVNFVESKEGSIEVISDQGIIKNKVFGKDKLTNQGLFLVKLKDFEFIKAALYLDEGSEIVPVSHIKPKDFDKYLAFKNEFLKTATKGFVFFGEQSVQINKVNNYKNLVNGQNVKELSDKIDAFFDKKGFYESSGIPFYKTVSLVGEFGSGRCTFAKSLILETNHKVLVCSVGTSPDNLVSTFNEASKQKSIVYLEYFDEWMGQIDPALMKELFDSSDFSNGVVVMASFEKEENIPSMFKRKGFSFENVKFNGPDVKEFCEYMKEFSLSDKVIKSLSKDFVKNKMKWCDLADVKNRIKLVINNENVKEIDDLAKSVFKEVVKESKQLQEKIDIEQYFNKESE